MNGIEADEARELAAAFEATPDVDAVRRGVRSLQRVMGCNKPRQATPGRFDLSLIHADTDPAALAERLACSGERRLSLCLQGPPGTGKSAFVRFLVERLGLEGYPIAMEQFWSLRKPSTRSPQGA